MKLYLQGSLLHSRGIGFVKWCSFCSSILYKGEFFTLSYNALQVLRLTGGPEDRRWFWMIIRLRTGGYFTWHKNPTKYSNTTNAFQGTEDGVKCDRRKADRKERWPSSEILMKGIGKGENKTKKRIEHLHYCSLSMDFHLPPLWQLDCMGNMKSEIIFIKLEHSSKHFCVCVCVT